MKLTKSQIEQRHAWAEILQETDLPQGRDALCTDEGFCCLGVAALFGLAEPEELLTTVEDGFAGYKRADLRQFAEMNDIGNLTFEEIAEVVLLTCDGRSAWEAYALWETYEGEGAQTYEEEAQDDLISMSV